MFKIISRPLVQEGKLLIDTNRKVELLISYFDSILIKKQNQNFFQGNCKKQDGRLQSRNAWSGTLFYFTFNYFTFPRHMK